MVKLLGFLGVLGVLALLGPLGRFGCWVSVQNSQKYKAFETLTYRTRIPKPNSQTPPL